MEKVATGTMSDGANADIGLKKWMLWIPVIGTIPFLVINVAFIRFFRKHEKGYNDVPLKFSVGRIMEDLIPF